MTREKTSGVGEIPVQIPTPALPFGVTRRKCSKSLDLSFLIHQTGIVSTKSNEVTKSVTQSGPSRSGTCCLLLMCWTPRSIVASVGLRKRGCPLLLLFFLYTSQ